MEITSKLAIGAASAVLAASMFFTACETKEATASDKETTVDISAVPTKEEMIKKGEYFVLVGGCHDCHSPKVMTEHGPEPDMTRMLSGYPQDAPVPEIDPAIIGNWALMTMDLTAAVGPWGISFAANLTPHETTGLGGWDEEIFIQALRTGKHAGVGRPILPPMPWFNFGKMEEQDLKAIFAYLQSIPPIENKVHEPIPMDQLAKSPLIKLKGQAKS